METIRCKGAADAALVHDSSSWRLFVAKHGRLGEVAAARVAAPVARIPRELIDAAVREGCKSARLAVSGEVHPIDGAIPKSMPIAAVADTMRRAIAESTGADAASIVAAGRTYDWPGARKPVTLAAGFDSEWLTDAKEDLAESGIRFAGVAPLELAVLACRKPSRNESFALVGEGRTFAIPATRTAGANVQTAACGMRHFEADAANWLPRFRRAAPGAGSESDLKLAVVAGDAAAVVQTLADAGLQKVQAVGADGIVLAAVAAALESKANTVRGGGVPVADPWRVGKSKAWVWILLAAVAILAAPAVAGWWWERAAASECAALQQEAAKLKPVEAKIKKAQANLESARRELLREQSDEASRISVRRPMVAFVRAAYFFCRHAGKSVVLDSIAQDGNTINVRGTFTDPEDGVKMDAALVEYARKNGIAILKSESGRDADAGDAFLYRFEVSLDCSMVGSGVKEAK